MAEELVVKITADDKASGALKGIQGALGGIGNVAMGALKVGLGAATVGFGALAVGIGKAVGEASESERAVAKLDAVLKATGGAAGVTSEQAQKLASAFQNTTTFSDEMVLSAEAVLLRFKSINQDVFPQATALTLDLATALGTDATSAATLLGKALETPGEGLARLKQAGVAFTEAQEKQIQTMMQAGNVAGAQKLIMDELAQSVGGAARAAGDTFVGQLTILQNSFSDILETVGAAFLPTLKDLVKFVNENIIPALSKWATEIAPQVQAALRGIGDLARDVAAGDFTKLEEAFWKWINAVGGLVADKFTQLTSAFTTWVNSAEGQQQLSTVGEQMGNAIVEGIVKLFDQDKEGIGYRIGNGLYQAAQAVPGAMADIGAGIAVGILNGILRQLTGYEFAENTRVAMRQMFSAAILDINDLVSNLFNPFALMRLGQVSAHAIGGVIPGSTSQGRLALVHGGEQIVPAGGLMRGGNGLTIQLNYAPALALGDEREFRDRLQPFIESAIVEARRRQI